MEVKDKNQKKKSNKKEDKDIDLFLNYFSVFFDKLSKDAELNKELLKHNIYGQMSQMLEKALKNPIDTIYKNYETTKSDTIRIIQDIIIMPYFAKLKQEGVVKNVYKDKKDNSVYYITLKENSLQNRKYINMFSDVYDSSIYNKQLPVYFIDIPNELEKDFNKELENNKVEKLL